MKQFDPNELTQRDNYKLLSGSVLPRPIAFVTSQDKEGNINAAPFSFFNVVSSNPPMIMISTGRLNGKRKDTSVNIETMGEFVVHISQLSMIEGINETAAPLAPGENELEHTDFKTIPSSIVDVPAIEGASIRFECKLDRLIELGDDESGNDLIIGRVVQYHIDDDVYMDPFKIDVKALQPVGRLAGNDYVELGKEFVIQRPTE
ncbi:flavin reductase family protein [Staphylococcus carnosus]|uniref:Flavin reductase like domain-containing protein n=1 Tax=Staphylococcus carnosus (strain TM300) TaxID=396513 RepID=B9DLT0_STACT|nr:flavin reductase family protein [Staphylococcus carnosus]KOR12866.1 hypothetical protein AMC75_06270 [Staphylococcus carnosus]QPT04812.1 flavin reductase family protein [Staphylococcus carnosus]UQA67537.1 flavin reductase family protein [Staphylococcus carnosus]UTB77631.1 hypothetical protein A2I62_03210 [Staphylococcus carnosus]UTB87175.1 hypothetical protein A2I63_03200 [Staphylococcus carnosus]